MTHARCELTIAILELGKVSGRNNEQGFPRRTYFLRPCRFARSGSRYIVGYHERPMTTKSIPQSSFWSICQIVGYHLCQSTVK